MLLWRVHNWPAFWTVVCLGLTQVVVTYYGSRLTIQGLPSHVPDRQRRTHRRVFGGLFLLFVCLTLVLAKLNDSNQFRADQTVEQERERQAALQRQLQQTLDTVRDSRNELETIKAAVGARPDGQERNSMLNSIARIQRNLDREENAMHSEPDSK